MSRLESILTVSTNEGADLWTYETGSHIHSINSSISANGDIHMLDEEHIVIQHSTKSAILIINIRTGETVSSSTVSGTINKICVSKDKSYIVAGTTTGKIYIWKATTGELLVVFNAHYGNITALTFSLDTVFLFSGGDDCAQNVWIVGEILQRSKQYFKPFIKFNEHMLSITSIYCNNNSSSTGEILTSSLDKTVKRYSLLLKTMVESIDFSSGITYILVDPTETYLYASGIDGNIYKVAFKDTITKQVSTMTTDDISSLVTVDTKSTQIKDDTKQTMVKMVGHKQQVTSLALSLDGSILYSTSIDGTIHIWDINTNQSIRVLSSTRSSYTAVISLYNVYDALHVKKKFIIPFTRLQKSIDSNDSLEFDSTLSSNKDDNSIATIKSHNLQLNTTMEDKAKDMDIHTILSNRRLHVRPYEVLKSIDNNMKTKETNTDKMSDTVFNEDLSNQTRGELLLEVQKWKAAANTLYKKVYNTK